MGRVQLGGPNRYGGQIKAKPILGAGLRAPDVAAIGELMAMNERLEQVWLVTAGLVMVAAAVALFITKTLS
jgi:cobalamin biosynthesis protein CobD/CbiB